MKQAPAPVERNASRKFLFSRKVRSKGPAKSSGLTPAIMRPRSAPFATSAPVKAAISPSASGVSARENTASLMYLSTPRARPSPKRHSSEIRPAAEAEELGLVVRLLGERLREIEADRAERRGPDQAHASRGADRTGVGNADRNVFLGSGRSRRARNQRGPAGTVWIADARKRRA